MSSSSLSISSPTSKNIDDYITSKLSNVKKTSNAIYYGRWAR